jgi:hypothetical protein
VINQIFKEGFHPENKRQRYRGVDICDDIFDIHLRKGEKIEIGKLTLTICSLVLSPGVNSTIRVPRMQHESSVIKDGDPDVDVYTSSKALSAPIYGAQYDFSGLGLELEVAAREQSTGKIMKAKFDFIG